MKKKIKIKKNEEFYARDNLIYNMHFSKFVFDIFSLFFLVIKIATWNKFSQCQMNLSDRNQDFQYFKFGAFRGQESLIPPNINFSVFWIRRLFHRREEGWGRSRSRLEEKGKLYLNFQIVHNWNFQIFGFHIIFGLN